jgi:transposase
MSTPIAVVAGVDISQEHLDVAIYPSGAARRFVNDRKGHTALLRWIEPLAVERIVFEATGPYHRLFERRIGQQGLPFAKINPRHARRFAEATGKLAKTDRVDAAMLARFGALIEPECRPLRSQALDQLAEIVAARRALIRDRTATTNRSKSLTLGLLKRQAANRLQQIDRQIDALDAEAKALVSADPALARRLAILASIPGVGVPTAIAMIANMPELGQIDAKQAAALAGLAPITRQSGKWQGKSSIRGGRSHLRQALYMPALVAARFNPDLKRCFDALVAAGKPPKVAITAIMRKIIVLANALLRDNRAWTETIA